MTGVLISEILGPVDGPYIPADLPTLKIVWRLIPYSIDLEVAV